MFASDPNVSEEWSSSADSESTDPSARLNDNNDDDDNNDDNDNQNNGQESRSVPIATTALESSASAIHKDAHDHRDMETLADLSLDNGTVVDVDAVAWCIAVKTVGADAADFTVKVCPDDSLVQLQSLIEHQTGVTAEHQRLIYRGRLIDGSKLTQIRDIAGLDDGHTIHMVRKRDGNPSLSSHGTPREATAVTNSAAATTTTSSTASTTGALLAALLGISTADDDDNTTRNAATATTTTTTTTGSADPGEIMQLRVPRSARRRTHHRLSSEDLIVPDPGSMEHVRQGLLTLHTLLPVAEQIQRQQQHQSEVLPSSPLDLQRRWYVGQWIDCRDTVNQWLEATIVEIVEPEDILPPPTSSTADPSPLQPAASALNTPTVTPVTDPIVSASDIEGRRRLLLEPCDEGCEHDEGGGLKRRANNQHVQLLLIHYNGWPHRWDEWIRSDSERIRPFRVRTRHPNVSSTALPTPISSFAESPPTFIHSDNNETYDRLAMLPELARVASTVTSRLDEAARLAQQVVSTLPRRRVDHEHLPWNGGAAAATTTTRSSSTPSSSTSTTTAIVPCVPTSPITTAVPATAEYCREDDEAQLRRQLEVLVTLVDRLGRTLLDAAPHIASLASELPLSDREELNSIEEERTAGTLGGLLSLLNRGDRRTDDDQSPHSAQRRRQSNASSNLAVSSVVDHAAVEDPTPVSVDPDYTDFATGVVNTTRGEVRGGPRRRGVQQDDMASVLGAYLAAASLASIASGDDDGNNEITTSGIGRLLRERGAGVGGIDIHIHAVVTSPVGGGTVGILTPIWINQPPTASTAMGSNNTPTAANSNNNNTANTTTSPFGSFFRDRHTSSNVPSPTTGTAVTPQSSHWMEDEQGIFADLYSENPDPVNPTSPLSLTSPVSTRSHESPMYGSMELNATSPSYSSASPRRRSPSPNAVRRRGNSFLSRFFRRSPTNR